MKFVLIFGPPASGKMTVGQVLSDRTGFRLFHNHMSIELVNQFFDFGTPEFTRLDDLIRLAIFREVAQSELPGLIFTLVWDLNDPEDHEYVDQIMQIFQDTGAQVHLVELKTSLEERLKRNKHPHRLAHKPSKRNLENSEKNLLQSEKVNRMNTREGELSNFRILRIDNTFKTPEETARVIVKHYDL